MSDEPIKLFSTRAERYPTPDGSDHARAAFEKIAEQVPILGPVTVSVVSKFLVPEIESRREEWFKELAAVVDKLESRREFPSIEGLIEDKAFVSFIIKTSRIAIGTHQKEKWAMLRNALLNIATCKAPNELQEEIFLNAIENFSVAHIKVLDVVRNGFSGKNLWDINGIPGPNRNYGSAIQIKVPELKGQNGLIHFILTDLRNRGFSNLSGPDAPFPQGAPLTITNMGIAFLEFVLTPNGLHE